LFTDDALTPGTGGSAAIIDLGSQHLISDIYASAQHAVVAEISTLATSPFDPTPTWHFLANTSAGATPANWPPVCDGWGWKSQWCGWNISKTGVLARYLKIAVLEPSSLTEVVLYGKAVGAPPPPTPPPPPVKEPPLMHDFIGINSFVTEPTARQIAAGSIREYHDFVWDEGAGDPCFPKALNKFAPDYSGFNSDEFYNRTAKSGINIHVVVQGRPSCQFAANTSTSHWKVVNSNSLIGTPATEQPSSYTQIGAHLFQYAARYGRTAVPAAELTLGSDQSKRSGLGWVEGLEVGNEVNGAWAGRQAFMSPVEQAAMMSAAYDGHGKTLPAGVGIKNADSTMLAVMGGLSGAGRTALTIVEMMRLWFAKYRADGKFAADVLNFHFYCNDDQVSKGDSPEECQFEEVMQNLTQWRDEKAPGLQVWLTEFGYDTNMHSPNLAPAYGEYDAEQVQGMWLLRSYMYMVLARIDRAHMFMLADVSDNGHGAWFLDRSLHSNECH
jgi:hypothetical protein